MQQGFLAQLSCHPITEPAVERQRVVARSEPKMTSHIGELLENWPKSIAMSGAPCEPRYAGLHHCLKRTTFVVQARVLGVLGQAPARPDAAIGHNKLEHTRVRRK